MPFFLLSLAMSLGFLAYAILGLGIAGILSHSILLTAAVLYLFLLVLYFIGSRQYLTNPLHWPFKFSIGDWVLTALTLTALAAAAAGLLAPETANDSLCYHLNLPKIYLQQGRVGSVPFDYNSEFPLLMEMLYLLGLGLGPVPLAKFFHFITGLLTAGLVGWTVRHLTRSRQAGCWAGVLLLTSPVFFNQITTTYVDAALACFSFFSWTCLILWHEEPEKKGKMLVLAGIFSGLAMSVKYLALISILIQVLMIIVVSFRKTPKKLLLNLIIFSLPAVLFGVYWYARAWLVTGNPVYPYFAQIFGSGNTGIHYDDIGVKKNLWEFIKVFWTLTMKPQIFEGLGVQIGPGYLAFLPAALLGLKKHPVTAWFWVYSGLFLAAWFLLGQSLRFLLPVLPVMAVLIGVGFEALSTGWAARIFRVLFLFVIALQTGLAVYHARRDFTTSFGLQDREVYLKRYERSYEMARYVNANLPADAKILSADETHMFYFQRSMTREAALAGMGDIYWKGAANPQDVIKNLKSRGFSHILRATRQEDSPQTTGLEPLRVPVFIETAENQLAPVLNSLYTYQFTDEEGITTSYTLYKIL